MAGNESVTIEDIDGISSLCTGCGACAAACPAGSICMTTDREGFSYPRVDNNQCIACHKCLNVCQASRDSAKHNPIEIEALYASRKDERAAGSSGGIMGLLAKRVLESNGVVFGAVFDAEGHRVIHASTETHSLEKILRSKYVQSEAWPTYARVKQHLCSGEQVLFCGTPCQVIGLNRYLGKQYSNLLTVDFFCHGVPSPGFFADYARLVESQKGSRLTDVTFREKSHGWREQHMRWYFSDGSNIEEPSLDNCHYFFFLGNYSLRKSCYTCELYKRHEADITLADYWLIDPSFDDDLGTSLVLANTENGLTFLREIKKDTIEIPVDNFDFEIYRHSYCSNKRADFFDCYVNEGIEATCGSYFEKEHRAWCIRNRCGAIKNALVSKIKNCIGVFAR